MAPSAPSGWMGNRPLHTEVPGYKTTGLFFQPPETLAGLPPPSPPAAEGLLALGRSEQAERSPFGRGR